MTPRTTLAPGVPWPYAVADYVVVRKGRRPPRFSPAQADEIRMLCKEGMTRKEVAFMHHVHIGTIDCVIARKDAYRIKETKCLLN